MPHSDDRNLNTPDTPDTYETVHLEKDMYGRPGLSFTQVLESLDPSENYQSTPLEGLDAFQRQLKRFGIKARGTRSDPVEKFFGSGQTAVLFPEFIARTVARGMEDADILSGISASVTDIDDEDGAVGTKCGPSRLRTHCKLLASSYEEVRYQKLDLFSVTLRQIGACIARMRTGYAVETLLGKAGDDGPVFAGSAHALNGKELAALWNELDPYRMDTLLADGRAAATLLAPSPHAAVSMIDVLEARLVKTPAVPAGTLIGLDSRYALEMVRCGGPLVEYGNLIDRKLKGTSITVTDGFARIFPDAVRVLEYVLP